MKQNNLKDNLRGSHFFVQENQL